MLHKLLIVLTHLNMFKFSSNFHTDSSNAVLLLLILCVTCVSCLPVMLFCPFIAALWSSAGNGLTSLLSCL